MNIKDPPCYLIWADFLCQYLFLILLGLEDDFLLSQVTSENPDSSKNDSTEDKKDIAIYQLQKNQLEPEETDPALLLSEPSIKLWYAPVEEQELAQSGEITIEDIPEGVLGKKAAAAGMKNIKSRRRSRLLYTLFLDKSQN